MISWKSAQEKELLDWKGRPFESEKERWSGFLKKHLQYKRLGKVLDVGCGPDGLVFYIQAKEKIGLDPLAKEFKKLRKSSNGVRLVEGVGEKIPFKSNSFSTVFFMNALDHVQNPKKSLKEAMRVVKKDGFLLLEVHCYPLLDKLFMKAGYKDPNFAYHPHKMSARQVLELIKKAGFEFEIIELQNLRPPVKPFLKTGRLFFHTLFRTMDYFAGLLDKEDFGQILLVEVRKKSV